MMDLSITCFKLSQVTGWITILAALVLVMSVLRVLFNVAVTSGRAL